MANRMTALTLQERMSEGLRRSRYRNMWLIAMFDLPVITREQRRRHALFRKELKKLGFDRLQLSIYAYFCPGEEVARVVRKNVQACLPPAGQVRLIQVTDRQFGRMDVFFGKRPVEAEEAPSQILLL